MCLGGYSLPVTILRFVCSCTQIWLLRWVGGSVNSTRARPCGILPSYPLAEVGLPGRCITTAPYVLEWNWQGNIWAHICVPEKLAVLTECNSDPEGIGVSLVLESFSKEPCIFGKKRCLKSLRESQPICFCVTDSGKDNAALTGPSTCGHLTANLFQVIRQDLVS